MSPSAWMAQCFRETDSSLRHSALAGSRPMLVSASFKCVIVPFLAPTTTAILGSMVSSHLRKHNTMSRGHNVLHWSFNCESIARIHVSKNSLAKDQRKSHRAGCATNDSLVAYSFLVTCLHQKPGFSTTAHEITFFLTDRVCHTTRVVPPCSAKRAPLSDGPNVI